MNTLIIGCGVIGTIYGYTMQKAGVSITHYVRENKTERFKDGIALQLLDARINKPAVELKDTYYPNIVSDFNQDDNYDLVIISVNFYQLENVLQLVSGKFPKAAFLIFNNMWEGYEQIEKYLPADQYLLGFPGAGGGYIQKDMPTLKGAILKDIHIGEKTGLESQRLKEISNLFGKADIKAQVEENMLHWLWVHFAVNSGLNSAMAMAHGAKNFLSGTTFIKQGIRNVKEALKVCEARKVQIKQFGDARIFLMPASILAIMFKQTMKSDKASAHVTLTYKGAEELKRIYDYVILTARQLNVSIPNLESMKGEVEKAEKYFL